MNRYGFGDQDDQQLADRLKDIVSQAKDECRPFYTTFLNIKQRAFARKILSEKKDIAFSFWGGFAEAERMVCAVYPDWMVEITYPIVQLRVKWKGKDELTHRDFLGAVLHLGIARDRIGDIVITEGGGFLAVLQGIAPYLQNNLVTVGRCTVQSVEAGDFSNMQAEKKFVTKSDTIASPRLDCVVAALLDFSRGDAQKLVAAQYVSVDWEMVDATDFIIRENQVISIRGEGRFQIDTIGPQTKKGRLHIIFSKYI